jgi:micrococcal nuclease
MRQAIFVILAGLGLIACTRERDPLAALQPGERGRVVRVIDGDALVLDTGQSVRLVGIEAPAGPARRREGEPGHELAKRQLEDLALGREVELFYGGLTRDKYDRALAQVRTADALGPTFWLNAEMVRRGGARVRVYADTAAANAEFLPIEAAARAEKAGLWGKGIWLIHAASALPPEAERFQIIEAVVTGMRGSDAYDAVCELTLAETTLVLEVQTAAAEFCQSTKGAHVRVRGYISRGAMEITHPLNIEVFAAAKPPAPRE